MGERIGTIDAAEAVQTQSTTASRTGEPLLVVQNLKKYFPIKRAF